RDMSATRQKNWKHGLIEALEPRVLLSAWPSNLWGREGRHAVRRGIRTAIAAAAQTRVHSGAIAARDPGGVVPHATTPPPLAFIPAHIPRAYGMDQVMFGSVKGDGFGQTIAIIDAYHYPTAYTDLLAFDLQFGVPDLALYDAQSPPPPGTPYLRIV